MIEIVGGALGGAIMITSFIGIMMVAVEYLNILTRGTLERGLRRTPGLQYVSAVALGAVPGCLGAFTVVALYSHRVVTVGAVVGAMIATSGDEAFVLLALMPGTALWLMLGLSVVALVVAPVVDRLAGARRFASESCSRLAVHDGDCRCFPGPDVLRAWLRPGRHRVLLFAVMVGSVAWAVGGGPGVPGGWGWVRVTLVVITLFATFVVATVPDHFLREHLWGHVLRHHVPRIFAWTGGALLGMALLEQAVGAGSIPHVGDGALLILASLIGLIPESGPHLVFVTLYAEGHLPLSVLVASSIVQDGHGMLPLLAQSRGDFVRVKAVNLIVGLVVGAVLLLADA